MSNGMPLWVSPFFKNAVFTMVLRPVKGSLFWQTSEKMADILEEEGFCLMRFNDKN